MRRQHKYVEKSLRLLLFFSFLFSLFSLSAQTIGEAFYIYRNDGGFNAFFREEVDSMAYSCYDVDSILHDDYVTQLIYTRDSTYRIPLTAIDSLSFVQPETKYREGVVPLIGTLFDYLTDVNGYTLTFDQALPIDITPRVGDKLVATDLTDQLPYGFTGLVRQVTPGFGGIVVVCDSIGLEDAVSQFYQVIEIGVSDEGEVKPIIPHKARTTTTRNYDLPIGKITLPPISLSAFIREKNIFDINANNTLDITLIPRVSVKITRVIDDNRFLSHTNVHVVTNVDATAVWDVAGEATKDWKMSYLPKQEFPMPFLAGYPLYFDIGGRASISGEIAAGFTINASAHQITDITLYDISLTPLVGSVIGAITNRVDGNIALTHFDMAWSYLGVRANLTLTPLYLRVGLPVGTHQVAWAGGDFDAGLKADAELMFDIRRIQNAEPGTAVYDELKDLAKLDIKPYLGAHFMATVADDRYAFKFGNQFENPQWTWYQGRPLPEFSNTEATLIGATTAQIKANITNDCPIPYTVGFAVYDEDGNSATNPVYYQHKYWTRNAFPSYSANVIGLVYGKKYKVYPVIRWFGNDNLVMLCSPSADLNMVFPVTLSDFEVTKSQYKKGEFKNGEDAYDYCFNVSVKAALDIDDLSQIADWGYVYEDPNGHKKEISLKEFGTEYTDTRYAYYRNKPDFNCRLYGYVKYVGWADPIYGEPEDFVLEFMGITVTTGEATEVTDNSAVLYGQLTDFDLSSISEYGISYYTTPDDLQNIPASNIDEDGVFSVLIENLSDQTEYYYYAYGIEEGENKEGEVLNFTTLEKDRVTVTTGEAREVSDCSAVLYGQLADFDLSTISEYGIYYYTTPDDLQNIPASNIDEDGVFSVLLENLSEQTKYYYYAYGIEQGEQNDGEVLNFTTYTRFDGNISAFEQNKADCRWGDVSFGTKITAKMPSLDNVEEWGIYVYDLNGSGAYDYYPSEFIAGQLEDLFDIDFKINKSEFDEINMEDFVATKRVRMGLYQIIKKPTGNYYYTSYFYSEPQEFELTYDKKPSLSFTETQFKETEPYTEPNDHNWDAKTSFDIKYDVQGALFIDKLVDVLWGSWVNPGKTDMNDYYIYDGEHTERRYGIIYKKPGYSAPYRSIEMVCGDNIIYSNNYLQFISDEEQYSSLQIIGGSPSYGRKLVPQNNTLYAPCGIPEDN